MKISNEFFYPGKVTYNVFNIDFNKPFADQLEELNEDLIQIKYGDDYLLDIGWYPEGNENGKIVIQVIYMFQWEKPIIREEVSSLNALLNCIKKIVNSLSN